MSILILPAAIAVWVWAFLPLGSIRMAFVRALLVFATAAVLIAELLSVSRGLGALEAVLCWCVMLAAGIWLRWRLRRGGEPRAVKAPSLFEAVCIAAIVVMASVTAWVALLSAPNSADAMSYHLPRIVYWIQNRSVAFFPTSYLNQIMLQPVAEYIALQTFLLSGGDRFVNLVQFGGYVGSIVAVSMMAGVLGLSSRGQVVAAVFCATLPNAILQASGAKNDCVLAFFLVCAALFAVRWVADRRTTDLVFLAIAAGLALGTKGTAYLFVPPIVAGSVLAAGKLGAVRWRDWRAAAVAICAGVLLINLPMYVRNYDLSGSILGFDSAQGDGFFRWRNESFGWKPTVSNLLRNLSEQLGGRSEVRNQQVYAFVLRAHRALGIDPQDPATTWRWSEYRAPENANHEANGNNRWHLLILVIAGVFACYRAVARREMRWLFYSCGLLAAFLAFCFYLKWQPYLSRLELPLYVAAAPLGAMLISRLRFGIVQAVICFVLVANSRLAVTQNWTRPLVSPKSIQNVPREMQYFTDMVQWDNRESYLAAVAKAAASGCRLIGTDISVNHLEYPFMALLRAKDPDVKFMHAGVENASAKYDSGGAGKPCVVLCLDCVGMAEKMLKYREMGEPVTIGRFQLFSRPLK